ncbi:alpha/beta fold hydrolase [Candidatus Marimicrobium litorale]|uniref:Alpha/beta hydrolase n=1 Tax=Candidatus Marimicrobium litorale TaxID=2518991 RepID=A0ABT3T2S2_9GAMM|nr:alpha/beta hydrolase [Candidatus Marimicrobium litorale]MCX2976554.1 alpha/beta hydrolase [Candidatus Marimicrobium litorale]
MTQAESSRQARARRFEVNGLAISGLSWGDPAEAPLLALHGWLDNAASFACVAPLLQGYHVIALDLTGHGQSDWRSADASYQIWDDLPEVLGVADALGWDRFNLIGHSRGAIISTLLASSFPERVEKLIMLDALSPGPVVAEQFPQQLRRALIEKPALLGRDNRVFSSVEAAIDSRCRTGLSRAAAEMLVKRSVRGCQRGLTWTADPRLHGASAVKLTDGQIRAVLSGLEMPTLLMAAQTNARRMPDMVQQAKEYIPSVLVEEVEGGHHFHMESATADVAKRILAFLV